MKNAGWVLAAVVAAWTGGVWAAGEADDLIQQAIRGATTNTEKAQKLLAAAEMTKDEPKLATALLDKAIEFALKDLSQPEARETAEKALALLADKGLPPADMAARRAQVYRQLCTAERTYEGKDRAARRLLPVLMDLARQAEEAGKYQAAADTYAEIDTLAGKYKLPEKALAAYRARRAKALVTADTKAKQLQTALKTNPADTKARMSLLKLLVLEKDSPAEASRWLADDVDQAWQANVKLAAGEPDSLGEGAARELGEWYYAHMQTPDAPLHVKGVAAARARNYYQRFLGQHKNQDQPALRARLALTEIESFLATIGGSAAPDDGSIDLLANVDTTKNATAGQWVRAELGLAVNAKDSTNGLLEIPPLAQPVGNYELTVTFARIAGFSTVAIVFPVGARHATLVLDRYARYSGLEHLDPNYYYYRNSSGAIGGNHPFKPLVNKKAYTATIVVTPKPNGVMRVVATLNDQELSAWEGKETDLLNRRSGDWDLQAAGAFGLGAYRGQVIFNKARLKVLK
ncbi:MAG: hypothetical protein NTV86_13350 [Planctomycetota bacterium]|nr:hypothetical protein [Planctomycetota bacterium]